MNLKTLSIAALKKKRVAILGYGNQGRAQALNLRDSGILVTLGLRSGTSFTQATKDGFSPVSFKEAVASAEVIVFLLPDEIIPKIYAEVATSLMTGERFIGFSHGFCYHFNLIERFSNAHYFLVSPKGAGAILREKFETGEGLPGVFAVDSASSPETRQIALAYAKGIGVAQSVLIETSFREETETDLFGEQTVLCGAIPALMEGAFETLIENGHSPEMAFFECCYEAKLILDLWMKNGPAGLANKISPTAFYGGLSRGRRLITDSTKKEMGKIFQEIRSGEFAEEWMKEVASGKESLKAERNRLQKSTNQKVFEKLFPNSQGH